MCALRVLVRAGVFFRQRAAYEVRISDWSSDVCSSDLHAPDAGNTPRAIKGAEQRGIYLLFDFHPYLRYATTERLLREIVQRRECQPHTLVLVGAKIELPEALQSHAVTFSLRLPDENALLKLVRDEAQVYARENAGKRVQVDADALRALVRNLRGQIGSAHV